MCVCYIQGSGIDCVPRWWNFDIVIVWITGAGCFFFKPRIKTGNPDVAIRALFFWLQRNERLSGSEAFSRVRSRYSGRGISRPDVSFWKSLHTAYADRVPRTGSPVTLRFKRRGDSSVLPRVGAPRCGHGAAFSRSPVPQS